MVPNDQHGLEALENIFHKRESLMAELKDSGKKIIGYLCSFAPPEIISAGGMIPYRILGRMGDEVVEADSYLEPMGCPYIRNCFEQELKGKLGFLDGRIIPHSCDSAQRVYGLWNHYRKAPYSYMFNMPHRPTPYSRDFFQRELTFFRESIERFAGVTISDEMLEETVQLYNENRTMVQELYEFRKEEPPRISGTEMFKILVAGMTIPPEEFNMHLKAIKGEVRNRNEQDSVLPRIMLWGCVLDDIALFELIEKAGSYVVTDDTCIGTRSYLRQIDTSQGIMEGFTKAYFEDFQCPRTDRGPGVGRFDYVLDLIRDYRVQGVVCYTLSFCDPHKLDYPDFRDYLNKNGVSTLLVDDDYTLSNIESIKNRVEAFLEILH